MLFSELYLLSPVNTDKLHCKCKHLWSAAGERSLGTIIRICIFIFYLLINRITKPGLQTRLLPYIVMNFALRFVLSGAQWCDLQSTLMPECMFVQMKSLLLLYFHAYLNLTPFPSSSSAHSPTSPTAQRRMHTSLHTLFGRTDSGYVRGFVNGILHAQVCEQYM